MVREIKSLIKDQKRAGNTGPLNLESEEVSEKLYERNLKRHGSVVHKTGSLLGIIPDGGPDSDDLEGSADGMLISAMTQLAWERDIDLTKGAAFSKKEGNIKEEPENENNNAVSHSAKRLRSRKSSRNTMRTPPGLDTGWDSPGDMSPVETKGTSKTFDLKENPKSTKPKVKTARVSPAPDEDRVDNSRPNSNNSNSNNEADYPLPPRPRRDGTKRGKHVKLGKIGKQPSSSSNDSAFSETVMRRKGKGIRQNSKNSTSSSSLTSLMNAWDKEEERSTDL